MTKLTIIFNVKITHTLKEFEINLYRLMNLNTGNFNSLKQTLSHIKKIHPATGFILKFVLGNCKTERFTFVSF